MVFLAFLALIVFLFLALIAVSNEPPGKIVALILVFAIVMTVPWAATTVYRWFVQ